MRNLIRLCAALAAAAVLLAVTGCTVPAATSFSTTPGGTGSSPIHVSTNANEWTWVSGSNVAGHAGSYGTMGIASTENVPGGRSGAVGWADASGNLWLFGGMSPNVGGYCVPYTGLCFAGTNSWYNDLWKFNGSGWTWVAGSSGTDQPGVYGTLGVAAAGNTPGARYGAVSWTDASGNFWLFGGEGYDSAGNTGYLNDLWKFSNGLWTWMGGSNAINQPGVYGTQGAAAPGNFPGARDAALSFTDSAGHLWLFGGQGCDSTINCGKYMSDLWEYSGGQWTWVSGLSTYWPTPPGVYGTEGTPAPGNHPGGRTNPAGWMDASGNIWIFGGVGWGASLVNVSELNDLWEFSKGEWAWVGGPNQTYPNVDLTGIYGTEGQAAASNMPGSRDTAASWTDAQGSFWLFGGEGFGSTYQPGSPYLNDLWKFNGGEWTWVGGSNVGGQIGTYGTLGTPAAGNVPGARMGSVTWTDAAGNLWLFGGVGADSVSVGGGYLNDLWVYQP
jgi:hypothetical protein